MARSKLLARPSKSHALLDYVDDKFASDKARARAGRSPWKLFEEEDQEDEALWGPPTARRARPKKTKTPTTKDRLKSAIGGNSKQAVVKIISYGRGASSVENQMQYIGRKGDLALETQDGEHLQTSQEIKDLVDEWSVDFREGEKARNSLHMQVSAPYGSDPKATLDAAREFAKEIFGGERDYVFVRHDDTDYPHVHIIAKMRGYDGRQLNPRKDDLEHWRKVWAEKGREQGIMMVASSRRERGQSRKSDKMGVRKLKDRGEIPHFYLATARDVLSGQGYEHASSVEAVKAEALKEYKLIGLGLTQAARDSSEGEDRANLIDLAQHVKAQTDRMGETVTLREKMEKHHRENPSLKSPDRLAKSLLDFENQARSAAKEQERGFTARQDEGSGASGRGFEPRDTSTSEDRGFGPRKTDGDRGFTKREDGPDFER